VSEAVRVAPRIGARQVAAAVAGNALEFYDFTVYSIFSHQIGEAFFPGHSPYISQIETLITFGVGFIPRPLGAWVIGRLGDRIGRRPAMMLSFALMGASILGLALTPTYRQVGLLAPIMVLFWRLCQGFALGGEVGPTTAFLVEAAPPARRGWFGAWQGGSQNLANIVGALIGIGVTASFGAAALGAWGWRAAFLVGASALPFGLLLRRALPETLHHPEPPPPRHARPPVATWIAIVQGLGLVAATSIPTYVFLYLTPYAFQALKMPATVSLAATLSSGALGFAGGLIGGVLSDRFGRKPMLIWPRVAFLLATWPIFDAIVTRHDATTLLVGSAILNFLSSLSTASVYVAITESLRKEVRVTGLGGIYAIAVAVFGGTTQFIVRWMIQVTGDPRSIAIYTIAATLVGLVASISLRETAHRKLARAGAAA
jgi:MFS family permease